MELTPDQRHELLYHEAVYQAVRLYEILAGRSPLPGKEMLLEIREILLKLIDDDGELGTVLEQSVKDCDAGLEYIP